MPRFIGTVTEMQAVVRQYEVEADTSAEASEKMSRGDTVSEMTIKTEGIVNRIVKGVPQEML